MAASWAWFSDDISRSGTDYLQRAAISLKNIYLNAPDHAVYGQAFTNADGDLLTGQDVNTIRFESEMFPPVNWFWSLTMYDATTTAMYPNDAQRYNISDRTKGLIYSDDDSLTINMSHKEPNDPAELANWRPAPAGDYYLVLRLYGARPEVIDGKWTPPPIQKSDAD